MDKGIPKETTIRVLIEEAHSVDQKVSHLLISGDRLLGVGMTVSMAILAGGIERPRGRTRYLGWYDGINGNLSWGVEGA